MDEITRGLFSFIEQSPTAFHAVENARSALEEAGYRPLLESGEWKLEPGQGYYVTRNQSSLAAFRVPEHIRCVMAGAAHTDSPCLKLKDHMELITRAKDAMASLGIEPIRRPDETTAARQPVLKYKDTL